MLIFCTSNAVESDKRESNKGQKIQSLEHQSPSAGLLRMGGEEPVNLKIVSGSTCSVFNLNMFWYCGHRDLYCRRDLDRRSSAATQVPTQVRAYLSSSHPKKKERKSKAQSVQGESFQNKFSKGMKRSSGVLNKNPPPFFDFKGHFDSGYVSADVVSFLFFYAGCARGLWWSK